MTDINRARTHEERAATEQVTGALAYLARAYGRGAASNAFGAYLREYASKSTPEAEQAQPALPVSVSDQLRDIYKAYGGNPNDFGPSRSETAEIVRAKADEARMIAEAVATLRESHSRSCDSRPASGHMFGGDCPQVVLWRKEAHR
jgi:hypothetical protein